METMKSTKSRLTDQEWSELNKLVGLPRAAREGLESIIELLRSDFKQERGWSGRMQDTRLAMKTARRDLEKAYKSLHFLSKTDATAFMAKAEFRYEDEWITKLGKDAREKLSLALRALGDLRSAFPPSEKHIPHAPTGRSISALRHAMTQLDTLLSTHTGKRLTQSNSMVEFAHQVLRRGQSELSKSAVRQQIKRLRGRQRDGSE